MTIASKKEKLHDFVNTANDQQVEAIFSIFEDELAEKYDHWADEEFVAEMKSRIDDFESGKDKGMSWEEVKLKVRNQLKLTK